MNYALFLSLFLIAIPCITESMQLFRGMIRPARATQLFTPNRLCVMPCRRITTNEAYKVFGFDGIKKPSITPHDIKWLYHILLKCYHADLNPALGKLANEKTLAINAAYKIILEDQPYTGQSDFNLAQKTDELQKEYHAWAEYQKFKQKKEEELRQAAARRQKQKRTIAFVTGGILGAGVLTFGALQLYEQYAVEELHIAIENGDEATVKKLLSRSKASINKKNKAGDAPLIAALKKNNPDIAMQLIQAGADIGTVDAQNNGPLLWASAKGFKEVVQMIIPIMNSTERMAADGSGNTALHNAVLFGRDELALFLAAQPDIDISARNQDKKTALQLAGESNNGTLFSQLLAIADKKNLSNAPTTPKNMSVVNLWNSIEQNSTEKINSSDYFKHRNRFKKSVIENRFAIDQSIAFDASTLLILAVINNDYEMASLLLKKEANANLSDLYGRTALHYARSPFLAETLKQCSADLNKKDHNGDTALHLFASNNDYGMVQWLLNNNAQTDIKNDRGTTPIFNASTANMVRLFKKHNASLKTLDNDEASLLHYAMFRNQEPEIILEYPDLAQTNPKDKMGRNPWHYLATSCDGTSAQNLANKTQYYLPYGQQTLLHKDARGETPLDATSKHPSQRSKSNCQTLAQVFKTLAEQQNKNHK